MKLLIPLAAMGAAVSLMRASFFSSFFKQKSEQCPAGHVQPCGGPCPACEVCPLSAVSVGQTCCLMGVGSGRRLRRRLAELGLTPGVEMTVLQNTGGPVMICVRNSRLALGRQMAQELDVQPLSAPEAI